jgi:hypothetical protein
MTRNPVTLADQGVLLEPDDVDELVDLLTDAATVIGHLAGHPAAEAALAAGGTGLARDCGELTLDLRLAAARLDEDAAAQPVSDQIGSHDGKGGNAERKSPGHAAENQHSGEGQR